MQTNSPATAENHGTATGEMPSPSPTQTTTTPTEIRSAEDLAGIDDLSTLTALMDGSRDVGFEGTTKPKWKSGFEETSEDEQADEDPAGDEPTEETAEAQPGETEESTTTEGESEEGQTEPAAAKMPKKEPNNVRLKRERFGPDVQPIIDLMAVERSLTFEQAQARLISEGKLKEGTPKTESASKPTPATVAVTADLETKRTEIASLEQRIAEAAETYDTKEVAKLTIEHNKALNTLNRLEDKAEQIAEAAKNAPPPAKSEVEVRSEATALERYPDAGKQGSELREGILDWLEDPANAELAKRPNWPLLAATEVAEALDIAPVAKTGAKPKPVLVPKRAAREVVRPASGSSAQATARQAAPSYEQAIAAAEAEGDPLKLASLMDQVSGRRAA